MCLSSTVFENRDNDTLLENYEFVILHLYSTVGAGQLARSQLSLPLGNNLKLTRTKEKQADKHTRVDNF